MHDNYPNPFNTDITISFSLREKQTVSVRIYDLNGLLVKKFPEYLYYPGLNNVYWDTKDNYGKVVSSGFYLYEVKTRNKLHNDKMLLLK